MYFKQIFDDKLAQYSYIIGCQAEGTALIIDPMRDIDQYFEIATKEKLEIVAAADTHIHADYISGLREFAERGIKVYASDEGDKDWKYEWLINSNYDYQLLKDGDQFSIGNIHLKAWYTPGHTPEHLSYFITDGAGADEPMGIATGDFVFVGDVGRPDLLESAAGMENVMESSAKTLYRSVDDFKSLPDYLQIWPGHGSGSACGKALGAVPESTVGYELRYNASVKSATEERSFVDFILEGQPEPPYYFARMKRDNKIGPALLNGGLPIPSRMPVATVVKNTQNSRAVVLDTRDREDFNNGHLPGSLSSPLNKNFNTVAGSFIEEKTKIYLVVEPHRLEEAVRDLIRIGLDDIVGYISPEQLEQTKEPLETFHPIRFDELDKVLSEKNAKVLDVRKLSEYQEGHAEDAVNIAHTRMLPRLEELDSNQHYVLHCQSGVRAGVTAAFLKAKGFDVTPVLDDFSNLKS